VSSGGGGCARATWASANMNKAKIDSLAIVIFSPANFLIGQD
jgi:hypothetical protein